MIKKYRIHYEVELNDGSDESAYDAFDVEAGDEQEALESMLDFETRYVDLSSVEIEELDDDDETFEG